MTAPYLSGLGQAIAKTVKTPEQRDELARAYKERMEYIKGGEGL